MANKTNCRYIKSCKQEIDGGCMGGGGKNNCFKTPTEAPMPQDSLGSAGFELLDAVNELFEGIDNTESESPYGWWPTSTGAEFGAEKLAKLKSLLGI